MNLSQSLTYVLPISAFTNPESPDAGKVVQVTPDQVTRFAFDKASGYQKVEIGNQSGPINDGLLEVIDVIRLVSNQLDVSGYDRAIIARLQTDELSVDAIQAIGETLESYMGRNGTNQFATAAIHDIGEGQELFGHWNTIVFTCDYNGKWSAKKLGFVSVQKSTGDTFAILRDGQLARIDDDSLVSTLLDNSKFRALLDGGYRLSGNKKKHGSLTNQWGLP